MFKRSLLLAAVGATFATSASAQLLVYEPFDYGDQYLTGQGGALGTVGTWATNDSGDTNGVYSHPTGVTGTTIDPAESIPVVFDGIYSNIAYSGGFAGMSGPDQRPGDSTDKGTGNSNMNIGLDSSVTATFTTGNTTWFSLVAAQAWDRNQMMPQFMIGNATDTTGSRGLALDGGDGIGGGGGPSRFNLQDLYPQYFDAGINNHVPGGYQNDTGTNGAGTFGLHDGQQLAFGSGNDNTASGQLNENGVLPLTQTTASIRYEDEVNSTGFGAVNIYVGKIEWDADTNGEDIITLVNFGEDEALSEAAFDAKVAATPLLSSANWTTGPWAGGADNKPDLDQSTFDTINVSFLKNYIDEIRLGETFGDVAPAAAGLPGDTDGDGDIDDSDLGTSFSNYTGPVGAAGGKTAAEGDTDGDGDVDDSDLGTSFSGYTGPLGPASVPEPTSLALLGLGGLALIRRRRA